MIVAKLILLVASLLALATNVVEASKCSICEKIVEDLISKGSCDAAKDLCEHISPPEDVICFGVVECCCDLLLHYIQEHLKDPSKICSKVHLCSSEEQVLDSLREIAQADQAGPVLSNRIALNTVAMTYDAALDVNTSASATVYRDFDKGVRRADFSTFGAQGSMWIDDLNTTAPTTVMFVNGTCSPPQKYTGPPIPNSAAFWQDADFEGDEVLPVFGLVSKYTKLDNGHFFVGYFDPNGAPVETWVHYESKFRTIEVSGGMRTQFDDSELVHCRA